VPASQSARAFQFGLLGVQLIGGTVKEAFLQKVGLKDELPEQVGKQGLQKYALNEGNADKLQQTFRKMRGAVLKLGQILSTGEQSIVPPVIRDAMERARSEADIMPVKQVVKILEKEYGSEWQKRFREINLYPFAAASIGQVHEGIIKDGTKVALKMQYTGVADSIDSDLNNFKRLIGSKVSHTDALYSLRLSSRALFE
jgi:aarF domain-containing kinase